MKFLHVIIPVSCALILSACTETSDFLDSSFEDVDASGNFDHRLDPDSRSLSNVVAAGGDGFSYQAGVIEDDGFVAEVGMLPTTRVSALPTNGSATYTGVYELAGYRDANLSGDLLIGFLFRDGGVITLNASFDDGTLRGTSDDGNLVVRGTFDGKDLDGSVEYNGLNGDLDGLIGGDRTVGIFEGGDDENIYAGGFIADEN